MDDRGNDPEALREGSPRESRWADVGGQAQRSIVRALVNDAWPIYMFGNPGRGKSCAAACVVAALGGSWFQADEIVDKVIRIRMSRESRSYENNTPYGISESSVMRRVERASIACFDDVALRGLSDAAYGIFYRMVNLRTNKPTIFTCNLHPKDAIEVLDSRVVSRMSRGTIIHFAGQDRRLEGVKIEEV